MNNWSTTISTVAVGVSVISLILAYSNNKRFASNQFINKQIDIIGDLVKVLHNDSFELSYIPSFSVESVFSYYSSVTLFEVPEINFKDKLNELPDAPILFDIGCNQLLDIKSFIDDPYLPKSIADALLEFYSIRLIEVQKTELVNLAIVLIKTKHLIEGSFTEYLADSNIFKQSSASALVDWNHFLSAIEKLEESINKYLKKYKVKEINIRKDLKHIYVS